MTRYQLARIVEWAGTLHSRKRMQKVVYLLQVAGCPLNLDYTLHRYGPYAHEVARLTDEMVRAKLLEEESGTTLYGVQYAYRLSESTRKQLEDFERGSPGPEGSSPMAAFESKAKVLIDADLKDLEIAATLVFFRQQGHNWGEAAEKTRQFKNLSPAHPLLGRAEDLARRIVS